MTAKTPIELLAGDHWGMSVTYTFLIDVPATYYLPSDADHSLYTNFKSIGE